MARTIIVSNHRRNPDGANVAESFGEPRRSLTAGGGIVGGMTTRKTSVSLSDEAIAAAGAAARRQGLSVSAWLSHAAIEQAWREQAIVAADEMYDEAVRVSGELTPEDERWVAETVAQTTRRTQPDAA